MIIWKIVALITLFTTNQELNYTYYKDFPTEESCKAEINGVAVALEKVITDKGFEFKDWEGKIECILENTAENTTLHKGQQAEPLGG